MYAIIDWLKSAAVGIFATPEYTAEPVVYAGLEGWHAPT